jgi:mono/diheme cytochrome c family protein
VAGEAVFSETCANCHGPTGTEGTAPSLLEEVPEHSDERLVEIIQFGEEDMPPIQITDQEIADVLAYVRQEFGEFEGGHEH